MPADLPAGLWPGLWVVATPIGNLSDISERARLALASADRILCEDTRRVSQLLSALETGTPARQERPLVRLDAHADAGRLEQALQWLEAGENLALVTDAGTPAISDPGSELVRLAHESGIRVTPIPGASAVTTLLSVSGFGETAFSFRGFFPRKPSERASEVSAVLKASALSGTRLHVWFESPQRMLAAIGDLSAALGDGLGEHARLCAAKELTKLHEKIWAGSLRAVLEELRAHFAEEGELGEWCFALLLPPTDARVSRTGDSSDWVKALRCLLENAGENESQKARISASEAARRVSQYFGTPKREVYEMALRISGKKT